MNIGSSTPLQQLTPLKECFSINDVRTLVAKQLRVDIEFVTSETHFTNDLGADLLDRVELMLAIEDQFAGVEITDDDIEQIQVVGDLIRRLKTIIKAIAVAATVAAAKNGTWCKVEHCKRARCSGGEIRTLIDGR